MEIYYEDASDTSDIAIRDDIRVRVHVNNNRFGAGFITGVTLCYIALCIAIIVLG